MSKISKVLSRSFKTYEEAESWLNEMTSSYDQTEHPFLFHEIHEERGYLNVQSYSSHQPPGYYRAIFRYE